MVAPRAAEKKLRVKITTPLALVSDVDGIDECSVPTELGMIGVLPDHTQLMAEGGTGILRYRTGQKVTFFVVSGGIVEVQNNEVTVLADVGESGMNIDLGRARESLERARKRISGGVGVTEDGKEIDVQRALIAERRALARIAAVESHSQHNK
jgi:F-type H+-transporting ATPase subunit epsilon